MKRVMIVLLFLVALVAATWLWSYHSYQRMVRVVRTAEVNNDVSQMASELNAYDGSMQARILAEVPLLERRARTIRAIIAIERGDEMTSAESFAGVTIGGDDVLSAQALYNRGNLMVARAQLEAAKESYIRSLRIRPDDLQTKINLELLLQKIEQQQKGRKGSELMQMRKALMDYWLREDNDGKPGGESSKRIWR